MGQVNSTQASSNPPASEPMPPMPSSSPSSSSAPSSSASSSIPSVEDMRNLTSRILASTNDTIKNLRENIPGMPSSLSSITHSSSPSPDHVAVGAEAAQEAGASAASMTDGLGLATDSSPSVRVMSSNNSDKVLIYRPLKPENTAGPSGTGAGGESSSSVTTLDLIKMHYQLSADWVKSNPKTVAVGALGIVAAIITGTVAINSVRSYRQRQRQLRVLRDKDEAKREIVVITNVATLEGTVLALSLDQEGFVVFVGVPNQVRAEEVEKWGRADIYPVIVDSKKANPVEDLVHAVSNFLDQQNSTLLGGSPTSSSSSVIYQEELSSSTANIRLISPEHTLKSVSEAEAKRRHHGKMDSPLFRLAAVIVNPHSAALGSIEKVDLELWRQSIDTNITGTVIAAQKFLPLLRRTLALAKPRRSPRLILISSSITGSIGFPYQSAICASHHAIESIADSLRREIKSQGIDVVCLRPGITDRSFRKEWGEKSAKGNAGGLGLLNTMDPTKILRATFKSISTSSALCDVIYDAITSKKPASCVRVGSGSLSYSFVGWAVPRSMVDWSIKGTPVKVYTPSTTATAKFSSGSVAHEE